MAVIGQSFSKSAPVGGAKLIQHGHVLLVLDQRVSTYSNHDEFVHGHLGVLTI